jgi:hypothetical protein
LDAFLITSPQSIRIATESEGFCELVSLLICEDDRLSSVVVGQDDFWDVLDNGTVTVRPVLERMNAAMRYVPLLPIARLMLMGNPRAVRDGLVNPSDVNLKAVFAGPPAPRREPPVTDRDGALSNASPPADPGAMEEPDEDGDDDDDDDDDEVEMWSLDNPVPTKNGVLDCVWSETMKRPDDIPLKVWVLKAAGRIPSNVEPAELLKYFMKIQFWMRKSTESYRDFVVRSFRHLFTCLIRESSPHFEPLDRSDLHKVVATGLRSTVHLWKNLPDLLVSHQLVVTGYSRHSPKLPGLDFYSDKIKGGLGHAGGLEMLNVWHGVRTVKGGRLSVQKWPDGRCITCCLPTMANVP